MLLSIVVPVFNTNPKFIQECIESTNLLKNLCDYEIIIVNDGSTDSSVNECLENIEQKYPKLTCIKQQNMGLSGARNTGIKHAKGDFILPLDSDDILYDDIHYFIKHLKDNPNTQILFGDYHIFGDKTEHHQLGLFNNTELLLFSNRLTACSFFKKDIWTKIGGYDSDFKTMEDYEFWCRCAINGYHFSYLPYTYFCYRKIHDGQSLWQKTYHLRHKYHQKILNKLLPNNSIDLQDLHQIINQELKNQLHKKPRKAVALLIYTYFPKLYYWLCRKGMFSYKDNFIQF